MAITTTKGRRVDARVDALRGLGETGLVRYLRYDRPHSAYMVAAANGTERDLKGKDVAVYVAGFADCAAGIGTAIDEAVDAALASGVTDRDSLIKAIRSGLSKQVLRRVADANSLMEEPKRVA